MLLKQWRHWTISEEEHADQVRCYRAHIATSASTVGVYHMTAPQKFGSLSPAQLLIHSINRQEKWLASKTMLAQIPKTTSCWKPAASQRWLFLEVRLCKNGLLSPMIGKYVSISIHINLKNLLAEQWKQVNPANSQSCHSVSHAGCTHYILITCKKKF